MKALRGLSVSPKRFLGAMDSRGSCHFADMLQEVHCVYLRVYVRIGELELMKGVFEFCVGILRKVVIGIWPCMALVRSRIPSHPMRGVQ